MSILGTAYREAVEPDFKDKFLMHAGITRCAMTIEKDGITYGQGTPKAATSFKHEGNNVGFDIA